MLGNAFVVVNGIKIASVRSVNVFEQIPSGNSAEISRNGIKCSFALS